MEHKIDTTGILSNNNIITFDNFTKKKDNKLFEGKTPCDLFQEGKILNTTKEADQEKIGNTIPEGYKYITNIPEETQRALLKNQNFIDTNFPDIFEDHMISVGSKLDQLQDFQDDKWSDLGWKSKKEFQEWKIKPIAMWQRRILITKQQANYEFDTKDQKYKYQENGPQMDVLVGFGCELRNRKNGTWHTTYFKDDAEKEQITEHYKQYIIEIVKSAIENGNSHILLTAIGGGVFANENQELIAKGYRNAFLELNKEGDLDKIQVVCMQDNIKNHRLYDENLNDKILSGNGKEQFALAQEINKQKGKAIVTIGGDGEWAEKKKKKNGTITHGGQCYLAHIKENTLKGTSDEDSAWFFKDFVGLNIPKIEQKRFAEIDKEKEITNSIQKNNKSQILQQKGKTTKKDCQLSTQIIDKSLINDENLNFIKLYLFYNANNQAEAAQICQQNNWGGIPSGQKYLNEVLNYNDNQMESYHDYIQFLLPTQTQSTFNGDAPIVDGNLKNKLLKMNGFKDKYMSGLNKYLGYIGWNNNTKEFDNQKFKSIMHMNSKHNQFRFTRMIESMRIFGFDSNLVNTLVTKAKSLIENEYWKKSNHKVLKEKGNTFIAEQAQNSYNNSFNTVLKTKEDINVVDTEVANITQQIKQNIKIICKKNQESIYTNNSKDETFVQKEKKKIGEENIVNDVTNSLSEALKTNKDTQKIESIEKPKNELIKIEKGIINPESTKIFIQNEKDRENFMIYCLEKGYEISYYGEKEIYKNKHNIPPIRIENNNNTKYLVESLGYNGDEFLKKLKSKQLHIK